MVPTLEAVAHPRQRRKEARPAELMAAALELFVEKGFVGTRLEDVAARAGVSKGTLYLYFDSKEALFKAVIQEGIVPILEEGAGLVDSFEGSAADLLRTLIGEWWQRMGNTPLAGVPKLMISEAGNFPELATYYHDAVIVRGRDLMRRTLQRGIASGEFRAVDVETAIDVIFAPVLMMLIWRYSLGACCGIAHDPQTYLNTHFDLTLGGLVAPTTRTRAAR
ncbi:MAG: transcriptional regulator [Rhodocyclaceae bacterium]|jgi:AcrR family transcriptional regulator|nr:MAG: transcriptional regulator [Rhodocyclaceae bacterium]TNC98966.1 MAG: transcriptional regulator [Rhodocyclaceae bacterium]